NTVADNDITRGPIRHDSCPPAGVGSDDMCENFNKKRLRASHETPEKSYPTGMKASTVPAGGFRAPSGCHFGGAGQPGRRWDASCGIGLLKEAMLWHPWRIDRSS